MTESNSTREHEIIFKDLSADDGDQVPMEIESLCMQCHENVIHFFPQESRVANLYQIF